MAESQKALNENRMKHLGRFAEQLPDVLSRIRDQAVETYKDGVLNSKIKRLMAMAIALGAGCRNCVLGQATYALECGAFCTCKSLSNDRSLSHDDGLLYSLLRGSQVAYIQYRSLGDC